MKFTMQNLKIGTKLYTKGKLQNYNHQTIPKSNPLKLMYRNLGYHILYCAIAATKEENWSSQKIETIKKNTSDPLGVPYYQLH